MLRTMLAIYRAHPLPAESDPRLAEFRSQMLIYVEKSCSGGSPDVNARILELYDHYEAYDEIIRLCSELMETGDKCEWAPPMARALKKQGRLSEAVQLLSAIG
jgi:hypothetical protein